MKKKNKRRKERIEIAEMAEMARWENQNRLILNNFLENKAYLDHSMSTIKIGEAV